LMAARGRVAGERNEEVNMGWGRYLLLGDFGQQLDLGDQKAEIEELREELRQRREPGVDVAGQIRQLQDENDELRLYVAALARILVSKGVIGKEELRRVVDAVDKEDGSADGRFTGPIG